MDDRAEAAGRSVSGWLADALGTPLLGYLLNCDSVVIQAIVDGEHLLRGGQLQVIKALSARRSALFQDLDEAGLREAVRHWLLQVGDDGRSNATLLRTLTCREVTPAPVGTDE